MQKVWYVHSSSNHCPFSFILPTNKRPKAVRPCVVFCPLSGVEIAPENTLFLAGNAVNYGCETLLELVLCVWCRGQCRGIHADSQESLRAIAAYVYVESLEFIVYDSCFPGFTDVLKVCVLLLCGLLRWLRSAVRMIPNPHAPNEDGRPWRGSTIQAGGCPALGVR